MRLFSLSFYFCFLSTDLGELAVCECQRWGKKGNKLRNISGNYWVPAWGCLMGFKKYKQMTCVIFKLALVTESSFFSYRTTLRLTPAVCDFIDKTPIWPFWGLCLSHCGLGEPCLLPCCLSKLLLTNSSASKAQLQNSAICECQCLTPLPPNERPYVSMATPSHLSHYLAFGNIFFH